MIYTIITTLGLTIYAIETIMDMDFSSLPFLYIAADILIAIEYDHVHTHDIASLISEQQKYHSTKGYAAFDLNKRYLSCNEKMYETLPEISKQIVDKCLDENSRPASIFYTLINDYKTQNINHLNFNIEETVYQCEISEFSMRKNGKIQGYLFDIRDVTEEQKYIEIMKDYNETLNSEVRKKTSMATMPTLRRVPPCRTALSSQWQTWWKTATTIPEAM